jgi:hypothetical protein
MKAVLINKYNKVASSGNVVRMYVYKVTAANTDELLDYELTQGVNYRTDEDGSPLYFTTNFEGNAVDLVKSKTKDRVTGQLTDAYRPLSSEVFELQRSIITSAMRQPTVSTVSKASIASIDTAAADI